MSRSGGGNLNNFGRANFAASRSHVHPVLIYESRVKANTCYQFQKAKQYKHPPSYSSWSCITCQQIKKMSVRSPYPVRVPRIIIDDDVILDDPDSPPNAPHSCEGVHPSVIAYYRSKLKTLGLAARGEISFGGLHETITELPETFDFLSPAQLEPAQRALRQERDRLASSIRQSRARRLRLEAASAVATAVENDVVDSGAATEISWEYGSEVPLPLVDHVDYVKTANQNPHQFFYDDIACYYEVEIEDSAVEEAADEEAEHHFLPPSQIRLG